MTTILVAALCACFLLIALGWLRKRAALGGIGRRGLESVSLYRDDRLRYTLIFEDRDEIKPENRNRSMNPDLDLDDYRARDSVVLGNFGSGKSHLISFLSHGLELPRSRQASSMHDWLETVAYYIPKEAREPFWNHMAEDRDRMMAAGKPDWLIRAAIGTQILWFVLLQVKSLVLDLVKVKRHE